METEQISGVVKSLRKDKTAVCVTHTQHGPEGEPYEGDEWFTLAEAVKPDYIHHGSKCECKIDKDFPTIPKTNRVVHFIKCEKSAYSKPYMNANQLTTTGEIAVGESHDNKTQALIVAQSIFKGTGKTEEFKIFVDEVHEYLNKGIWITKQKV